MLTLALLALSATPEKAPPALRLAVRDGDVARVTALLEKGAPVDARVEGGATLLGAAARAGRVELVKLLLGKGARQDSSDDRSIAPIHEAVRVADEARALELVRLLKDSVNQPDSYKATALHYAANRGSPALCKALLELGGNPLAADTSSRTPLHVAADSGGLSAVEVLLTAKQGLEAMDYYKQTPLLYALGSRSPTAPSVVAALVKAGANVNHVSRHSSVLAAATRRGNLEVVNTLLSAGADAKRFGADALTEAASAGSVELVKRLLAAGATVDAGTAEKAGPLHDLGVLGRVELLELLAAKAPSVDLPAPSNKRTPLHVAANAGVTEAVKALLELGADPAKKDNAGQTPRQLAEAEGHLDVLRLLLEKEGGAPTDLSKQQFAVVWGGGKSPQDAQQWLTFFRAEEEKVWKPNVVFAGGFPKTLESDQVPGMNKGFHVVVLGFCAADELKPAMQVLKARAERIYVRKVTSNPAPGSCPRPVLSRPRKAYDVLTDAQGNRLHVAVFAHPKQLFELQATLRTPLGGVLDSASVSANDGRPGSFEVELEKAGATVSYEFVTAGCYEPPGGTATVTSEGGKVVLGGQMTPPHWDTSCGE